MIKQITLLMVIAALVLIAITTSLSQQVPQQYSTRSIPAGYYFILDDAKASKCPKLTHPLKPRGALLGPSPTIMDLHAQQLNCLDQLHFQFTHIPQ